MSYELYVVTDEELSHGVSHVEIARQAVAGGVDIIQLRDKKLQGRDLFRVACGIREVTAISRALFIVNDRLDIALASKADGVHIGQQDLPLSVIRPLAPPPFIIGVSISSVEQAKAAEQDGADYVAVSPVFSTGSKHDAGPGLGLGLFREISDAVSIPVIGIGGIHKDNAIDVFASGADGIAVISAVICQPDIAEAARDLKEQIRKFRS